MSLLLAFEAAARHESYTRAAHELSLTQSAVSRQVQILEKMLGMRLFSREGRQVVLVPGQVEDDASIRCGCDVNVGVHTNLGLLQAARRSYPGAFIVYKPHPDVSSGNRKGKLALEQARAWADHVEVNASVVSCIEACDAVVTMTSLTGFDALLRGKHVVVHGRPFYAGWGLTTDVHPPERRRRLLSLDALVAGALILYPRYFSQSGSADSTPERALDDLDAWRSSAGAQMPAWRRAWRPVLQALAWWQDGKRRKGT